MKLTNNIYSIIMFAFVFIVILIFIETTPPQTETATFKIKPILEAKLNRDAFQTGETINLFLAVKNETNLAIGLLDAQPERSFDITVADTNGLNVLATAEGRKRMHPDIIMAHELISLERGKTFKFKEVRLNELFDLTKAGTYTLEIKRNYYLETDFTNEILANDKDYILTALLKFTVE